MYIVEGCARATGRTSSAFEHLLRRSIVQVGVEDDMLALQVLVHTQYFCVTLITLDGSLLSFDPHDHHDEEATIS